MRLRILVAALSGLVLSLAFDPVALPWLIPVAVAGFVLSVRGCRARAGALPGLAFGLTFFLVDLWWMRAVGPVAWVLLSFGEALFYAALGAVAAALHGRRLWPMWIAAAWAVTEVVRSSWPQGGMPWGRLGFAVIDSQAADLLPYTGVTGLGFVLALVGGVLAWFLASHDEARAAAVWALLGLLAVFMFPAFHTWEPTVTGSVTVAAVQGNVPGDGEDIIDHYRQVTQNQRAVTERLAREVSAGTEPSPAFVVWPENSTAIDPFLDIATNTDIRAAASAIGVPILVGAVVDDGPRYVLNQGIVWDPTTGAGDRYTKHHPVPYGEYVPFRSIFSSRTFGRLSVVPRDMVGGIRTTPLSIAGVRVADAICFDVAFDDVFYSQVDHGAQLITVQTSNATFIHTDQIDQQFDMTRVRALETGRAAVVASLDGVTGVIGSDGSVIDRADPRTQAVLVDRVPLDSGLTPAVRMGAWPGLVFVALMLVGLGGARIRALVTYPRRRTSDGSARPDRPSHDPVDDPDPRGANPEVSIR